MGLPAVVVIVSSMDMDAVIRQLQATMVVMAEIQRRQVPVLKAQGKWIAGQEMPNEGDRAAGRKARAENGRIRRYA